MEERIEEYPEIVQKMMHAIEGHTVAEVFAGMTTTIDIVCTSMGIDPLSLAERWVVWFSDREENAMEH